MLGAFFLLKKTGANIHLPDVNESEYFTPIKGNDVYTGFVHIKSLQQEMAKIIHERKRSGSYMHLQDFIERTDCTKEQLNMLIRVGAFGFTGKSKKKLLWEANFLQKKNKVDAGAGRPIFEEEPVLFALPNCRITGWMICLRNELSIKFGDRLIKNDTLI